MAQLEHIEAIEKRLWSAADTLRANSNFAANEFFMPVMGLIFLRHAYSRYLAVKDDVLKSLPSRGGRTREPTKEDFSARGAVFLRPEAQFDYLVSLPDSANRADAIIKAMESIEADYETLKGVLPKEEYNELDNEILGALLRKLNPEELKKMSGDVFGRIYEYFLTQFAGTKAHDGGEFFTPVSLVSFIARVLETDSGVVLDPACGSGGMFVQSARVVERQNQNPTEKLTFFGMEKNATTIRLAKMNLAVHGLEGDIAKAITYYEDPHELVGKADFVMANPPFNVDEIDADKIKNDPRLPFGLPSVNDKGKVSNGNYVWISYFYSYLNEHGRAGFVMAAGAESAGRGDALVRRKLVETGDVDIMVSIRSNFFYTRSVPCVLWFIDRGKPGQLDDRASHGQPSPPAPLPQGEGSGADTPSPCGRGSGVRAEGHYPVRAVGHYPVREVDHYRGGYDFSGLLKRARELRAQQTPAEAVFWELVRNRRFMGLKFRRQHQYGDYVLDFYCDSCKLAVELDGEIHEDTKRHDHKRDAYLTSCGLHVLRFKNSELLESTQEVFDKIARAVSSSPSGRGVGGEGDVAALDRRRYVLMIDARNVYRKVTRKINDFSPEQEQNLLAIVWLYRGETARYRELLAAYRKNGEEEAAAWLEERFPDGRYRDVEGLVKAVSLDEIAANDWSLTPGRYVGVAETDDGDEDFAEKFAALHDELRKLNAEAATLAKKIDANFKELMG